MLGGGEQRRLRRGAYTSAGATYMANTDFEIM